MFFLNCNKKKTLIVILSKIFFIFNAAYDLDNKILMMCFNIFFVITTTLEKKIYGDTSRDKVKMFKPKPNLNELSMNYFH